tara:strand:- start:1044 stop:1214 length:171 start_codon:yes stop_codon:yes gene_type:complete
VSENERKFEVLVELIHSAIESEQESPKLFSAETELRLNHVYLKLREALDIDPIVQL